MNPETLIYDPETRTYRAPGGDVWKATRRGGGGPVTGFLEVFGSRRAGFVSVPGVSRYVGVSGRAGARRAEEET